MEIGETNQSGFCLKINSIDVCFLIPVTISYYSKLLAVIEGKLVFSIIWFNFEPNLIIDFLERKQQNKIEIEQKV